MAKKLEKIIDILSTPHYFSNIIEENKTNGVYLNEIKTTYYTDKFMVSLLDIAKYPLMKIIHFFC